MHESLSPVLSPFEKAKIGAEEPQAAARENAQLGDVARQELSRILEQHREWVVSQGEAGKRADLSCANLEGADLTGANLREAVLRKANFRRADLFLADFRGACLMQADLRDTNLLGADLRDASLQRANLNGVTGLLAGRLACANLFEAVLADRGLYEGLEFAGRALKRAHQLLAALLFLCLCAWLIIAKTKDVQLLQNSGFLPIPRLGHYIPMLGFYMFGPVLLFGLYIFFHLYLQRVWQRLSELPAVFPDGRVLDKTGPWLLMGLARKHFSWLKGNPTPLSVLETGSAALLAYWVVPATLLLFWARYLTQQDLRGTMLHVALVVAATGFAIFLPHVTRRTVCPDDPQAEWFTSVSRNAKLHTRIAIALALGVLLTLLSVGTIYGTPQDSNRTFEQNPTDPRRWAAKVLWVIGYNPYANLTELDVSTKPMDWTGQEKELPVVNGARLSRLSLRHVEAYRAFLVNARLWQTDLRSANLSEADLRGANLREANLESAALDLARISRANLQGANLQRANLARTDLREADLAYSSLIDAVLVDTKLERATIYGANLRGARLVRADLQRADLREANLEGAWLRLADLREADLWSAKFPGAELKEAHLQGAILIEADLRKADLRGANLQEAILRGADLSGANLEGADLRGAKGLGIDQICSAAQRHGLQLEESLQREVDTRCGSLR